jgi:hypothetical protein
MTVLKNLRSLLADRTGTQDSDPQMSRFAFADLIGGKCFDEISNLSIFALPSLEL